MKKFLSLLTATVLTAGAGTAVVACNKNEKNIKTPDKDNNKNGEETPNPEKTEKERQEKNKKAFEYMVKLITQKKNLYDLVIKAEKIETKSEDLSKTILKAKEIFQNKEAILDEVQEILEKLTNNINNNNEKN